MRELSDKTARALTPAKKDNDFIYHERVPEVRDLERIGKAAMVKPTALQVPLSQKFSGKCCCFSSGCLWFQSQKDSDGICGPFNEISIPLNLVTI